MKVEIKRNFTFTIPKEARKKLKPKDIVIVSIKKKSIEYSFVGFVRNDNRIYVRSSTRKTLNISKGNIVDIKIKKLEEILRSKIIIKENKIDLLSLIPKRSRKGFPIRIFHDSDRLIIYEDVKRGHSANPLIINRFVSLDFCKFLGLLQAEGEKGLNKMGGNALTFTNILFSLLKLVIDVIREIGIEDQLIVVRVLVPKGTHKKKVKKTIDKFYIITNLSTKKIRINSIDKFKTTFDKNEQKFKNIVIRNIAFTIKIERTLFNELVLNSIFLIRKFLVKKKSFNKTEKLIACNFLSGIVMGDGTIGIGVDKRNSRKFFIEIKDADIHNLRECQEIFNKLTFKTKLKIDEYPPRLLVRVNWNNLFFVALKNEMFLENLNQWNKLLTTIRNMKQFKQGAIYL